MSWKYCPIVPRVGIRIVNGCIIDRKLEDVVESFGVGDESDDYKCQNSYVRLNASKTTMS